MRRLTIVSEIILLLVMIMTIAMLITIHGQFDEEINKSISTLEDYKNADLRLIIISDLHYDPNKDEPITLTQTFSTISKIRERLAKKDIIIDSLWNLGDFINGHTTTKAEAIEQINKIVNEQKRTLIEYHNITGNHDNNIQVTWNNPPLQDTEVLTVDELNTVLENKATSQIEHHNENWATDYYVDFKEQNIRVICISADNTTFKPETVEWLRKNALNTEHEVLILSHIPTRAEWGFKNDVIGGEAIEDALLSFVASGGTIIAYIHGHDHGDMINQVINPDGSVAWNSVAVGCARFQYPTSNGTQGMTFWERNADDETMILFDIMSIDQENRIVHFTRVGAGVDREIIY